MLSTLGAEGGRATMKFTCEVCRTEFERAPSLRKNERKFCSRWCWDIFHSARKNPKARKMIKIAGKWVSNARHVLEAKLGRKLARNEFSHHVDGDITNDAPENLELKTRPEHNTVHKSRKDEDERTKDLIIEGIYPKLGIQRKHITHWYTGTPSVTDRIVRELLELGLIETYERYDPNPLAGRPAETFKLTDKGQKHHEATKKKEP